MKLLIMSFLFFLTSCSFANDTVTDNAVLYYNDLSLIQKNGTCVLQSTASSKTEKIVLALKPPCYFVRDGKSKKLNHFPYPRLDADFVVIIFGNPLSDDDKKLWNIKDSKICGGSAQGLIIKNNLVRISKKVLEGGLSCTHGGHDEKDYWAFAHDSYVADEN